MNMYIDLLPISKADFTKARKSNTILCETADTFLALSRDARVCFAYLTIAGTHYYGMVPFTSSTIDFDKFKNMVIEEKQEIMRVVCADFRKAA